MCGPFLLGKEINMKIKDVFNKLNGKDISENSAVVKQDDDEYTVTINTNNNLCTISVSTSCNRFENDKKIMDILSYNDEIIRYYLSDEGLQLKTTLWVDRKPTASSLTDLVNLMIAKTHNVKHFFEVLQ